VTESGLLVALDTNVLVRFLVEDDERQAKAAATLIGRAVSAGAALFVSDVVLCETVWVLAGGYRVPRAEIVATLREVLRAKHLAFESPDRLARALDAFSDGSGDFADYVIREHARSAGYEAVATFDRALLREDGFVAP
jgi:predicted nucleic-acid-binding protein